MGKHRKPTGVDGPIRLTRFDDGMSHEFLTFRWPATKEEIELLVINSFVRDASPAGLIRYEITGIQRLPQSDLDFRLATSRGAKLFELMELVSLEGYQAGTKPSNSYEMARWTRDKILEKSGRYGTRRANPMNLLLYSTHFGFSLESTELELVQYWTAVWPHVFEAIYFYRPTDAATGIGHVVFPTPIQRWIGYDAEKYREVKVLRLDPREWKPTRQ